MVTTAHCDTLIPCALEIFLLTYLLTTGASRARLSL